MQSLIPLPIVHIKKDGWNKYIPLNILANDFHTRYSQSSQKQFLHYDSKGCAPVKDTDTLPKLEEELLSPANLEAHISTYRVLHPMLSRTWERHYRDV